MLETKIIEDTKSNKKIVCGAIHLWLRKDHNSIRWQWEKEGEGNIISDYIYFTDKDNLFSRTIRDFNYMIWALNCSYFLMKDSKGMKYGFDLECVLTHRDFYGADDDYQKIIKHLCLDKDDCEQIFSILINDTVLMTMVDLLEGREPWK